MADAGSTPAPVFYARVVSILVRPETVLLALERFRDVSTPLVRQQEGSLGILGAANRETGRTYAISFWTTRGTLERSNANPRVVEAMAGYARWMAGPFTVESYAVMRGELPDALPELPAVGRITSILAPHPDLAAVVATFEQRLVQTESQYPECLGTMLYTPMVGTRVVGVELWSSVEALAESEPEALSEDHRLVREGSLPVLPTRDIIEVFGYY